MTVEPWFTCFSIDAFNLLGPDPLETVPLRVNRDISCLLLCSDLLSLWLSELELIYVTWPGHKAVTFPAYSANLLKLCCSGLLSSYRVISGRAVLAAATLSLIDARAIEIIIHLK